MLKIENMSLNVDIKDIIIELRNYLDSRGEYGYFNDIKDTPDNYMVTCPKHSNHSEAHPSCGVRKEDGMFHCFTCGYTATLQEVISNLLGYDDKGRKGAQWLEKNFVEQIIKERQELNLNLNRSVEKVVNIVSDKELEKYRFYHPYMFQRKLTKEIINKFDVGYDKEQKTLTFPVKDIYGRCLFITRRSVKNKYFYIPNNVVKPVYLLDTIIKENIKEVIICESQLNALTCWAYGKPAVALFGTGTNTQMEILKKSGVRHYILGFDGDQAGDRGRDKFIDKLKDYALISYYEIPRGKDINDLSKEEFESLKEISVNY